MELYNIHPQLAAKRKGGLYTALKNVPWHWLFLASIVVVFVIIYTVEHWNLQNSRPRLRFAGFNVAISSRKNFSGDVFDGIKRRDFKDVDAAYEANNYDGEDLASHPPILADISDIPTVEVVGARCDKIIEGDKMAIDEARSHQLKFPTHPIPDMKYVDLSTNCAFFRADRQYITKPVSEEEAKFPIAFSIVMFKDVEQFERLLRAIYRPQNYYCVHVDKKSTRAVFAAVRGIASCFENVFIASQSVSVSWGSFSVLQPEFICMEELWRYKKWKYYINLTGQEFPLKTNLDLVQILKVFNGTNNMEGTIMRRNKERTEYVYRGVFRTERRKFPPPVDVTITKGSLHITASRAFVDYILHDRRALEFRAWVKDTGIPDETFFSSLNHSPQLEVPGAYLGKPETNTRTYPFLTRFKNWGNGVFDYPCAGKRIRLICIFGIGDLKLLSERRELFANKFHLDYQPLTLSCLEQLHFNRTRNEISGSRVFDVEPYKHFDFIHNHI